jgi:2-dehydro-3-deoxy-D-arabinonate dehydratase
MAADGGRAMMLVRTSSGLALVEGDQVRARLPHSSLAELLRLRTTDLRAALDAAQPASGSTGRPLAPIDGETEVWAAGVTYRRSEEALVEESGTPDIYTKVYTPNDRAVFQPTWRRPDRGAVVVRADSTDTRVSGRLVVSRTRRSSATPSAATSAHTTSKAIIRCTCRKPRGRALVRSGTRITPGLGGNRSVRAGMRMRIVRNGQQHWSGEANTSELKRRLDDLVSYLFREDDFPDGVVLSTGTALVPETPFTLHHGDIVEIELDQLGLLRNPVVQGKGAL